MDRAAADYRVRGLTYQVLAYLNKQMSMRSGMTALFDKIQKEQAMSDYDKRAEELSGKELKYRKKGKDGLPELVDAVVVNIDRCLGCTIVKKDDTKYNLVCARGPMSPNVLDGSERESTWFAEMFEYLVDSIEGGLLDAYELIDAIETAGYWAYYNSGSASGCAYSV